MTLPRFDGPVLISDMRILCPPPTPAPMADRRPVRMPLSGIQPGLLA